MRFAVKYLSQFINQLPRDLLLLKEQLINLGLEVEDLIRIDNEDCIIEVAVPPNRADLLSIVGIARELAIVNNCNFKLPIINIINNTNIQYDNQNNNPIIFINSPQACPKYLSRVVLGINNIHKLKTPDWVEQVLVNARFKLISPMVDLANYVMLELGQPLHIFDLDQILTNVNNRKEVQVRFAIANEEMILLNNNKIVLHEQDLIIADAKKPLALAGVMGGLDSCITKETKNIFIEAAYFDHVIIRKTAARHNIISDAAQRFARNIDPNLASLALNRFSNLLKDLVGGIFNETQVIINDKYLPHLVTIQLYEKQIERILGITIEKTKVINILQSLSMRINSLKSDLGFGWEVTVPSWRRDIKIQEDLIEEIARCIGYNNLPKQELLLPLKIETPSSELNFITELPYKSCLVNRGYKEAINYSFIDPELAKIFYPTEQCYELKNPISNNMSVMRPGLLPGLFNSFKYNQNRQQNRIRLFEIGNVFNLGKDKNNHFIQTKKIAALVSGQLLEENWQSNCNVNFFNLKSDLVAILKQHHNFPVKELYFCIMDNHPAFHPAQSANIYFQDKHLGIIGVLHPKLIQQHSLVGLPVVFELNLHLIHRETLPRFKMLSKFPAIRRDFSVILDVNVSFEKIQKIITISCGELLQKVILFDVYTGNKLPKDKKSITFGIILQKLDHTLVEQEINSITSNIVHNLEKTGIYLRN